MWAAAVTGCPLVHAAVLLDKESGGGRNIWGPVPKCGMKQGSPVTLDSYAAYKAKRAECGAQGVGPLQLTWPALQDGADALGGAWVPKYNVQVGLGHFAQLLSGRTVQDAYSMWSTGKVGSSPYATDALSRVPKWQKVIDGT